MSIPFELYAVHNRKASSECGKDAEYQECLDLLITKLKQRQFPLLLSMVQTKTDVIYSQKTKDKIEWELQIAGYWFTDSTLPWGIVIDTKPHKNKEVLIVNT